MNADELNAVTKNLGVAAADIHRRGRQRNHTQAHALAD